MNSADATTTTSHGPPPPAIVERVRRLLALAQSDNEHEAQTAAAHAARLMAAHQLTEAMLEDEADAPREHAQRSDAVLAHGARVAAWKQKLIFAVATASSCAVLRTTWRDARHGGPGERRWSLVGRPSDAATAGYLYAYLVRAVDGLAAGQAGRGREWAASYRAGVAWRLAERLREARAAERERFRAQAPGPDGARAIVRVDERLAEARRAIAALTGGTSFRIHAPRVAMDAFDAGRRDGERVELGGGAGGLPEPARQIGPGR